MSDKAVEYNNNLFSIHGKMHRTAYIFLNLLINIIGFHFLYTTSLVNSMNSLHSDPNYTFILQALRSNPNNAALLDILNTKAPEATFLFLTIKYLFIIPFRVIDIKRIRDIINRELSGFEKLMAVVVLSLPYVDFFSTFFLSLIPANRYDKSNIAKEVQKTDLQDAQKEKFLELNKKLFESGKISKADFLKARDKYKP